MPLNAIQSLVSRGATEREIHAAFKADLRLVAQMCTLSLLKDEYISFSEYPVGHGRADFVVFTDRSRMAIVFVELKGADFPFIRQNGSVAHPINRAAQQVRERYAYVEQNYDAFRRHAHAVRIEVEGGAIRYRSAVGPNGFLYVDPDKHIRLQGIVVGGRTTDELAESNARHLLEKESPRIKFESWDSWLRNRGLLGSQLRPHDA